jgi:hypothetical protein
VFADSSQQVPCRQYHSHRHWSRFASFAHLVYVFAPLFTDGKTQSGSLTAESASLKTSGEILSPDSQRPLLAPYPKSMYSGAEYLSATLTAGSNECRLAALKRFNEPSVLPGASQEIIGLRLAAWLIWRKGFCCDFQFESYLLSPFVPVSCQALSW